MLNQIKKGVYSRAINEKYLLSILSRQFYALRYRMFATTVFNALETTDCEHTSQTSTWYTISRMYYVKLFNAIYLAIGQILTCESNKVVIVFNHNECMNCHCGKKLNVLLPHK